jgi:hypothetical protein
MPQKDNVKSMPSQLLCFARTKQSNQKKCAATKVLHRKEFKVRTAVAENHQLLVLVYNVLFFFVLMGRYAVIWLDTELQRLS